MKLHILCILLALQGLFHLGFSQNNYTLDLDLNHPYAFWTGAATPNDLLVLSAELGPYPDDLNLLVLDSNGVEKHFWQLHGTPTFQAYHERATIAKGDYLYVISQQYVSGVPVLIGYTLQKINFRTGQVVASRSVDYPILTSLGNFRLDIDNQGNLIIGAFAQKPLSVVINTSDLGLFLTKLDSNLNMLFEGFEWTQGYPTNGVHDIMATQDGGFLLFSSQPSAPVYFVSIPDVVKFDAQMNAEWRLIIDDNPTGFPQTWGYPEAFYETDTTYQFHYSFGYDRLLSIGKSGFPAWAKDSVVVWEKNNFIWDGKDIFVLGQLTYFSRKGDGTFNHNRSTTFPVGLTNANWMAPMGENQIALLCRPQSGGGNYLVVTNKTLDPHCSLSESGISTSPSPMPIPQYQRTFGNFNWTNESSYVDTIVRMTMAPDTHNLAPYCGCRIPNAFFQFSSNLLSVAFTNVSTNNGSQSFAWDFGDGNSSTLENPPHTYAQDGIYTVCLTVSDSCGSDTYCDTVQVSSVGLEAGHSLAVRLAPNPSTGLLRVGLPEGLGDPVDFSFFNALGETVHQVRRDGAAAEYDFDLTTLPAGIYILQVRVGEKSFAGRLVLEH